MSERSLSDLLTNNSDYFADNILSRMHTFYLSGTIGPASDYIDWFDIIRNAGENDIIKIHINSYGGDLFTAIQMIRCLNDSLASVIISVEGACMSAATMVFLCGDSFEVSPHSMFMFHNYSGGTFGKGGEMLDQLQHESVWSEKLLRDIYSDFLSEDEIVQMLNNKDLWMDGDTIVERLQEKAKKIQSLQDEAEDEEVQLNLDI